MPPTKTGPQTLLHDVVDELRRQGGTGVSLDHLEQIANTLAPKLSAQEFEKQKALLPLQHNRQMEQFKAVTEAGQTALKTAIAVNGGAAAALLAFLGSLAAKQLPAGTVSSTGKVALAMLVFVGGVLFASLALGARYFTQLTDAWGRTKLAARFNNTSALLGLASLLAFSVGGLLAFLALR